MPKLKMPKKPSINAQKSTWVRYEKKLKEYVDAKNERVRRRDLKETLVQKIKI
jgi:hypothetical protein